MITTVRSRWASAFSALLLITALGLLPAMSAAALPPTISTAVSIASLEASTGCFVVIDKNVRYCSATIDQVKQSRYPIGQRVVLKGVSVTAVSSTSITVSVGWPVFTPCPPGMFCGAGTSTWYQTDLVVPWTGTGRPTTPSVIDLYGSVTTGATTPTVKPGYRVVQPGGCYVDWAAMGLC